MAETTSRTLALLNLLQTHRQWAGPDLAERLGVTERTLRRDIERLRDLGYRVDATRGAAGGYRLEAGSQLPPLLLTDDEAVAMAIGLRVTASQGLIDGEQTSLAALATFEQVLPAALRARVAALTTVVEAANPGSAPVASDLLGRLALACRDRERLRFAYIAADGTETARVVEPHSLVAARRRWFLVCWDRDRDDWRTFRVDRIADIFATRVHFDERELPARDAAAFVEAAIAGLRDQQVGAVILHLSLKDLRERFGEYGDHATAIGPDRVSWPISGETLEAMLGSLAWVPADVQYEVVGSREFLEFASTTAARILHAATRALDTAPAS